MSMANWGKFPQAEDDRPATLRHGGHMTKEQVAALDAAVAAQHTHANQAVLDATTASFTTADEAKLDNWPRSRLVYVASSNLANALAVSATTWTDIVPNQSYTVNSATSILFVSVRIAVAIVNGASANEFALRAVIDSAGTPANVPLSGDSAAASGLANLGGGFFRDSGRAAGSHTIKIQVYGQAAFTAYCRASSNPNEEFAAITIDEMTP